MIARVIAGGQTGADQAGWHAAAAHGIPTGGWMPAGFKTEDGDRPEFAARFGAQALPTASYAERTRRNVELADTVLWFGDPCSPGGRLTLRLAMDLAITRGQHHGVRGHEHYAQPSHDAVLIAGQAAKLRRPITLMIAGNRESKAPGIAAWVERYLINVFAVLKASEALR
jgi:hypothetical protein